MSAQIYGCWLFIDDVWDYYTTANGTRCVVAVTSEGTVLTVPTAFVEVSA